MFVVGLAGRVPLVVHMPRCIPARDCWRVVWVRHGLSFSSRLTSAHRCRHSRCAMAASAAAAVLTARLAALGVAPQLSRMVWYVGGKMPIAPIARGQRSAVAAGSESGWRSSMAAPM
jgi:hypothetical protein